MIGGAGLAAVAAAKLLGDRGAEVRLVAPPRQTGRIVAIPIETVMLASSLFGCDVADLAIGTTVERRRVDWSDGAADTVPQTALVCDAGEFAAALARRLPPSCGLGGSMDDEDADWIVNAAGRSSDAVAGGTRIGQFAWIANVGSDVETTVTATALGWIFTAPHPRGGLAVLMVTPSAATAAATVGDVAARLALAGRDVPAADIVAIGRAEPVAPQFAAPLVEKNRVRVGDAALALDPLRGDGAGFALRGALLAQAVMSGIGEGGDRGQLAGHYDRRLREVFVSHLHGCSAHYRAARHAEIWRHDIAAMDHLAARMEPAAGGYEFRLDERDLVARERPPSQPGA